MTAARKIEKTAEAYRSIGEAAKELGLPTHVLRYWETKFPRHVKPVKRQDGRRLFRPEDLDGLRAIQTLVHRRGMTLKGAKGLLNEQGVDAVLNGHARLGIVIEDGCGSAVHAMQDKVREAFDTQMSSDRPVAVGSAGTPERLRGILAEMTDIKARLDAALESKAA